MKYNVHASVRIEPVKVLRFPFCSGCCPIECPLVQICVFKLSLVGNGCTSYHIDKDVLLEFVERDAH